MNSQDDFGFDYEYFKPMNRKEFRDFLVDLQDYPDEWQGVRASVTGWQAEMMDGWGSKPPPPNF